MERSFGILPRHARDQLQKDPGPAVGTEPLPPGTSGRATGAQVGVKTDSPDGVSFVVLGDSGGIKDPAPQNAVCEALAKEVSTAAADFVYHVGDLVYFNGDPDQWVPQFYEPYCHCLAGLPIVGIPGNHDGDSSDGVAGSGVASFMANLCASEPGVPPGDPQFEYGRSTQTQPYCDWTLALQSVWIIGVWSNVPSGGVLADSQVAWLTGELAAAPADVPVIVSLHHPPYSIDAHHGGSARMGTALDSAFAKAQRYPQLVLSGHVHDYQRFTRQINDPVISGEQKYAAEVIYVVQGNSGYHNLHKLATDAQPGEQLTNEVTFDAGFDDAWGFLTVDVTSDGLTLEAVGVDESGTMTTRDNFAITG